MRRRHRQLRQRIRREHDEQNQPRISKRNSRVIRPRRVLCSPRALNPTANCRCGFADSRRRRHICTLQPKHRRCMCDLHVDGSPFARSLTLNAAKNDNRRSTRNERRALEHSTDEKIYTREKCTFGAGIYADCMRDVGRYAFVLMPRAYSLTRSVLDASCGDTFVCERWRTSQRCVGAPPCKCGTHFRKM